MIRFGSFATLVMIGAGALSGAIHAHARVPASLDESGPLTLAVKFVEFTNGGHPVLTREQVHEVVRAVNQLYSPCNIHFRVEEYLPADPQRYGLSYHLASMSDLDPIRSPFDSRRMLVVTNTGSWDHGKMGSPNAWTAMPGEKPAGAVLEGPVATNSNIVAHELGHYLGLDHVTDTGDLMNPIIYSFSTRITPAQCRSMRQVAKSERPGALRG